MVLTYVRTADKELTEVLDTGLRVIDINKVEDHISLLKTENDLHQSDPNWLEYNTDNMDASITYFNGMSIDTVPPSPEFEPTIVSMCGILASMG